MAAESGFAFFPPLLIGSLARFLQVSKVVFMSAQGPQDPDLDYMSLLSVEQGLPVPLLHTFGHHGGPPCRGALPNTLLVDVDGHYHSQAGEECFRSNLYWLLPEGAMRGPPPGHLRLDSNFFTMSRSGLGGDTVMTLQEWYRFKAEKLFNNVVGTWSAGSGLEVREAATWERRRDLGGAPLRLATMPFKPMFFRDAGGDFAGLMVDCVRVLQERSNFTAEWVYPPDFKYGVPDGGGNGSWNGIIGMLQRREVDVGVTGLGITPERVEVADFIPHPAIKNKATLIILNPDVTSAGASGGIGRVNYMAYLTIFSLGSWILLAILFVLLSAVHHFLTAALSSSSSSSSSKDLRMGSGSFLEDLLTSMTFAYNAILQFEISVSRWSSNASGRSLFLTASGCSVVLMAYFQAMITSFMTEQVPPPKIHSLSDALENDYRIIFEEGTSYVASFARAPAGSGMRLVYERMMRDSPENFYPDRKSLAEAVLSGDPTEPVAIFSNEYLFLGNPTFLPLKQLDDALEDFTGYGYQVRDPGHSTPGWIVQVGRSSSPPPLPLPPPVRCFFFQKDSEILSLMSHNTLRFHLSGSFRYLFNKWFFFRKPTDKCGDGGGGRSEVGSLGYSNLLFVTLVTCGGMAMALFCFLMEHLLGRRKLLLASKIGVQHQ